MNLGLLGALGGLGQGMQVAGLDMIKQDNEVARDERSLIMQKNLLQARDDMDAAKARRISGEVNAEAGRIASTRATGLLASSREAVANAGNQDDPAVAKGLNDAQAEMSVPTTRDNIQASVNLGHTNPIDLLKLDAEERRTKAGEDANVNTNRRLDNQDRQATQRDTRDQNYRDIQDERNRILGLKAGAKGSAEDRVAGHQFIISLGKEIDGVRDDVKLKTKALTDMTLSDEDKAALKDEIKTLNARRSQLEKGRIDYAREAGIKIPAVLDSPAPAAPPTKSPYAEGTRLNGPGGKTYVVRNGVPVAE